MRMSRALTQCGKLPIVTATRFFHRIAKVRWRPIFGSEQLLREVYQFSMRNRVVSPYLHLESNPIRHPENSTAEFTETSIHRSLRIRHGNVVLSPDCGTFACLTAENASAAQYGRKYEHDCEAADSPSGCGVCCTHDGVLATYSSGGI